MEDGRDEDARGIFQVRVLLTLGGTEVCLPGIVEASEYLWSWHFHPPSIYSFLHSVVIEHLLRARHFRQVLGTRQ